MGYPNAELDALLSNNCAKTMHQTTVHYAVLSKLTALLLNSEQRALTPNDRKKVSMAAAFTAPMVSTPMPETTFVINADWLLALGVVKYIY